MFTNEDPFTNDEMDDYEYPWWEDDLEEMNRNESDDYRNEG